MPLGFSFSPGSDIQMNAGNGQSGGARGLSPQQAVKILSLRVPEALPSNAPVNRSLLMSPGGSAAGAGGLQSMIQQLIQAFKPSGAAPAAGGPTAQPSIAGGPISSGLEPFTQAPVGVPPRVAPGEQGGGQMPSASMPSPSAPAPFQPFPNAPTSYAPSPMFTPHITWGDEFQPGQPPPLNLGQNPDEIEAWSRMFQYGPSAIDYGRLLNR